MHHKSRTVALVSVALLILALGAATAGELSCVVSAKQGVQSDAEVTLVPGEVTLRTDGRGACTFRGLAPRTYKVTAERVIGRVLHAAILEEVKVPTTGRADVKLVLKRAIRIHEYTPLRHGSYWSYRQHNYTWHEAVSWLDLSGWREDGGWRTLEGTAAGTARFAGADVTKVEWTISGFLVSRTPLRTTYETSGPEGYATYGREPRLGEEATYRYDPPLLIPDLCPLSHTHRVRTTMRYADDTPSKHVTRTYTLTKFDQAKVHAGTFDDCALIEWTEEGNGPKTTGKMYLAKGVGLVFMTFDDDQALEEWALDRYQIPPPPAPSAAQTLPRSAKPSPPPSGVKTRGKSAPLR